MDKNIQLVAQVVSQLAELDIVTVENPTLFRAYEGAWGSIANYKMVKLSEIRALRRPDDSVTLGVYAVYEAKRESGEGLCDYEVKESRYVELDKLMDYLAERGIKKRQSVTAVLRARMGY